MIPNMPTHNHVHHQLPLNAYPSLLYASALLPYIKPTFNARSPSSTPLTHRAPRLPAMHKVKLNVHVYRPVPHFVGYFGNEDAALCLGPAQDFADEAEGVGLDAQKHVFALVAADFLHLGVFGPRTYWYLNDALVRHCWKKTRGFLPLQLSPGHLQTPRPASSASTYPPRKGPF